IQPFNDALALEVDSRRAPCFGHGEPLRQSIDGHNLFRAEQEGAADRHLSDRAAAPYSYGVAWLDVALNGALPSRGENIAEKKNLLVGEIVGDFDMRG